MEQPSTEKRKTHLNLVVGINGTGKSTWIKDNVVAMRHKVLVVTPDECEWRQLPLVSSAAEIFNLQQPSRIIYKGPETLDMVINAFFGGVLVLDDAMAYLSFQTSETMRWLYIRRRQRGVDVYLVAHGLRQVPVQCFTFGSYLVLFATTENFSSRKRELNDDIYLRIVEAQRKLNEQCRNHGDHYAKFIIKLDPSI